MRDGFAASSRSYHTYYLKEKFSVKSQINSHDQSTKFKTMKGRMNLRNITSATKLCAILGNPIEHTLSPLIHNAAFDHLHLNYVFLAFKVEHLKEAVHGIRALDIKGVSVTIPHKVAIIDYLDEVEEIAGKIGAVNTVVNRGGRLIGYNTDWSGAIRPLEAQVDLKGRKALVLGAGGAARAIAFGLKEKGADFTILNRTVHKAEMLASELGVNYGSLEDSASVPFDTVINTTSLGMYPNVKDTPVKKALLKGVLVFDMVYNPLKTRLIRDAEENGCATIMGLEMFINQAAMQFELWTGEKAPLDLMKKVVVEALS
jgi:shikimate dehydrogenase